MAQLLWAGDSQHFTRPDDRRPDRQQATKGFRRPARALLANALVGRHYDGGRMSGWGGAIWSRRACICHAKRDQWPRRERPVERVSGERVGFLESADSAGCQKGSAAEYDAGKEETPSPDRLRPGPASRGLNRAGKARHGGRDNRTRGDDSCFAGPRRGGRVGNEQATGELVSNNGPASAAGVQHRDTFDLSYLLPARWPAGGVNTGTLPHRVRSIAGVSTRRLHRLN